MKIYLHFSSTTFANSYLIGNEETKEAIIIDPCKITEKLIHQIEDNSFKLLTVLITRNHARSKQTGLKTILKIYEPEIYAFDRNIDDIETNVLRGDGVLKTAGFDIEYFSIPGHAPDSYMFKIENTVFIGASLSAGLMGKTQNIYAAKNLQTNLQNKLMAMPDDTVIMPAYGPPTRVGIERKFNSGLYKELKFKQGIK